MFLVNDTNTNADADTDSIVGDTIQYLTSSDRIGSSLWIRRIRYDIPFST